jgi:hypothetical protein
LLLVAQEFLIILGVPGISQTALQKNHIERIGLLSLFTFTIAIDNTFLPLSSFIFVLAFISNIQH